MLKSTHISFKDTMYQLFTSESVSDGHPDKVADQISDAILDATLAQDPQARCACETLVKNNLVIVAGEISTSTWVDVEKIVKEVVRDIGYTNHRWGFDAEAVTVLNLIGNQSTEIASCVNANDIKELGAGDQGMVFGFSCRDTETLMPLPIHLAHQLMAQHKKVRTYINLGPDAKSQVTVAYKDNKPHSIETIVLSSLHNDTTPQKIQQDIIEHIIRPVIPSHLMNEHTKIIVNPSGQFTIGGPVADAGLTGRKIIVDTYGGFAHHGGGCFSGKDPSKVDRSAAYMARYIAKNIVAAQLASHCEVQLSYAIGQSQPVSIAVNTFGTITAESECKLAQIIPSLFDCTPKGLIDELGLNQPIYRPVSYFGHFGRPELDLPWEKTDRCALLKKHFHGYPAHI